MDTITPVEKVGRAIYSNGELLYFECNREKDTWGFTAIDLFLDKIVFCQFPTLSFNEAMEKMAQRVHSFDKVQDAFID